MKDLVAKVQGTAKQPSEVVESASADQAGAENSVLQQSVEAQKEQKAADKAKRDKQKAEEAKKKEAEKAKREAERIKAAEQKEAEKQSKAALREAKKAQKQAAATHSKIQRDLKRAEASQEKMVKTARAEAANYPITKQASLVNVGRDVGIPRPETKAYEVLEACRPAVEAAIKAGEPVDIKSLVDMAMSEEHKDWNFERGLATVYVKASVERIECGVPTPEVLLKAMDDAEAKAKAETQANIDQLTKDLKAAEKALNTANAELAKLTPAEEKEEATA